jgi:protein TonB
MFDVVRGRSSAPTRLKPALVVSLFAHVLLLAWAILVVPSAPPPTAGPIVRVRVPQGSRSGGAAPTTPPARPPHPVGRKAPRAIRSPVEISRPVNLEARAAQDDDRSSPGDDLPGPPGPGGGGNGPECATPPCGGGQGPVEEDVVAEMPVLLSGPEVTLSPEDRRTGVEGTMVVRCVITAAGTVEGCEVLKGLPRADAAVLAALRARQYRPAQVAGRAVSVRHLFTIKFRQAR